jgi:MYXO-CTERM domain-containing protein
MMLPTRNAIVRPLLIVAAVLASLLAHPADASAQGRCSCNSGCHQYPGQCVQRSATGCDPGFAPFCGTRSATCPNTGWVSCDGECTCVRVPGGDAGVSDASVPPMDAPRSDASVVVDRPVAADAEPRVDVPLMSVDAPGSDVVASDQPLASDVSTPADRPAATDRPAASSDALVATDGGCVCPGGICLGGVCVTERCTYYPELGFLCAAAGTTCRLIEGEAYCVPVCVGVSCGAGEFCDESSNGQCVRDDCASRTCPAGTSCFHNQCGNYDGGVRGDAATADGSATGAGMTADESGCGCRASGPGRASSAAWWGVAALLFTIRRRKK